MKKRILSTMLVLCMVLTMVPSPSFGADEACAAGSLAAMRPS